MNVTLEDVRYVVDAAVAHFSRRCAPAPVEEMRQEAWEIALRASAKVDAAGANPTGYLYICVRRALSVSIARWLSSVSFRKIDRSRSIQVVPINSEGDIESFDGTLIHVPNLVHEDTPEVLALAAERRRRKATWRVAFRRALDAELSDWSPEDVAIAERLFGLDGLPITNRQEVAKHFNVEIARIYKVAWRLREKLGASVRMYQLERRLQEVLSP